MDFLKLDQSSIDAIAYKAAKTLVDCLNFHIFTSEHIA